jgi:hypothetical protein
MAGKNECRACGQVFGSLGAFDSHRVGKFSEPVYAPTDTKHKKPIGYSNPSRRCLTIPEIQSLGMVQNDKGWWISGQFNGAVFENESEKMEVES